VQTLAQQVIAEAFGAFLEVNPSAAKSIIQKCLTSARARDAAGNVAVARSDVWVAGDREWWFDVSDGYRMDVVPERRRYEPGESAVLQVRSPFRQASALVTVEREGVLDAFVTRLDGKAPVVKLPLKGVHAPNVFVSVLAVRGRVADVAPTALVDLGKPAFRMGVTELKVGWRAHELAVKVQPGQDVYRVRERAKVRVQVSRPDGKALPAGAEVAVAAVDEALLELLPNPAGAFFFDPEAFEVPTIDEPVILAPGTSLSFEISYRPTATLRSAVLRVVCDSDDGPLDLEMWGRISPW
jgi:uncharacterized protein YfaS (alpha-2-macroglobulin family)